MSGMTGGVQYGNNSFDIGDGVWSQNSNITNNSVVGGNKNKGGFWGRDGFGISDAAGLAKLYMGYDMLKHQKGVDKLNAKNNKIDQKNHLARAQSANKAFTGNPNYKQQAGDVYSDKIG
jgi:hypothetical protein